MVVLLELLFEFINLSLQISYRSFYIGLYRVQLLLLRRGKHVSHSYDFNGQVHQSFKCPRDCDVLQVALLLLLPSLRCPA